MDPRPGNQEMAMRHRQILKMSDRSVLLERWSEFGRLALQGGSGRNMVWPQSRKELRLELGVDVSV